MTSRRPRWTGIGLVVLLLGRCQPWYIHRLTTDSGAAGWSLVVNEQIESADIIVVAVDANGGGVLEAADLVHSGVATRVAVFTEPADTMVEQEFIRRGIPNEDAAARSIRQLRALWMTKSITFPDM